MDKLFDTKKLNTTLILLAVVIVLLLLIYLIAPEAFFAITGVLTNLPEVHILELDQSLTDGLINLVPGMGDGDVNLGGAVLTIDGDYLIICIALMVICAVISFFSKRLTCVPIIAMAALPFFGALGTLAASFKASVAAGATNWQAAGSVFLPFLLINFACIACASIPYSISILREGYDKLNVFYCIGFAIGIILTFGLVSLIPTLIAFVLMGFLQWTWTIWAGYIIIVSLWGLGGIAIAFTE